MQDSQSSPKTCLPIETSSKGKETRGRLSHGDTGARGQRERGLTATRQ